MLLEFFPLVGLGLGFFAQAKGSSLQNYSDFFL